MSVSFTNEFFCEFVENFRTKNVEAFGEQKQNKLTVFDVTTAAMNMDENCLLHVSSVSVTQCGFHHKTHPLSFWEP